MNKNNEIIAAFMGLEKIEGNYYHEHLGKARITVWMKKPQGNQVPCLYSNGQKHYRFKHELKYDKTWGELMPVVKEVKKYQLPSKASEIDKNKATKLKNEVRKALLQMKLMPLHVALVDYIEFINKQLNK